MTKTIFMIILLSFTGPGVASVQKTLYVGPALVECTGVALQRCYRIKENPDDAYSLYYDPIEGFEHQHGYEYQLLVEVITVDNPPADASSIRYRLVRELGREAVQFIRISAPGESETIDPAKPVTVRGTGRGLFEGNVVIRFEDLDGNPLVQVPTTMQQQDIGAPGAWQKNITLPSPVPQTIRLIAFSPSPLEGDVTITSIPVMLTTDTQAQSGLENTPWRLDRYRDESGNMVPVLPETIIDAELANGRISGNAGCNHYFGSYSTGQDKQLTLATDIGSTLMACPPPVSRQERHYLSLLPVIAAWQLQDGSLLLLDRDDQLVLRYLAVKPVTLEETNWQAGGINNGRGGVVSSKSTHRSTALFANGMVSGNAGCNHFKASYEIRGEPGGQQKITIGPAMTTRKHCAQPDGIMEQEQQYLQALMTRAHFWKITSDRLELRDDKGSLQVRYSVRPQSGQISEEDQAALDLGRKVLAVKEALRNPGTPNALQAVTDVGLDQRYYTMVRGWLAYQLQGDMSILDAGREGAPEGIRERVEFLKAAIRAIDLE